MLCFEFTCPVNEVKKKTKNTTESNKVSLTHVLMAHRQIWYILFMFILILLSIFSSIQEKMAPADLSISLLRASRSERALLKTAVKGYSSRWCCRPRVLTPQVIRRPVLLTDARTPSGVHVHVE